MFRRISGGSRGKKANWVAIADCGADDELRLRHERSLFQKTISSISWIVKGSRQRKQLGRAGESIMNKEPIFFPDSGSGPERNLKVNAALGRLHVLPIRLADSC